VDLIEKSIWSARNHITLD